MQAARAASRPVFVDVTAEWCITCKANKALVLERDPVASVLARAVADGKLVLQLQDMSVTATLVEGQFWLDEITMLFSSCNKGTLNAATPTEAP